MINIEVKKSKNFRSISSPFLAVFDRIVHPRDVRSGYDASVEPLRNPCPVVGVVVLFLVSSFVDGRSRLASIRIFRILRENLDPTSLVQREVSKSHPEAVQGLQIPPEVPWHLGSAYPARSIRASNPARSIRVRASNPTPSVFSRRSQHTLLHSAPSLDNCP